MKFQKVRLYLSPPRIDRYLTATNNQQSRAIRLYKANLRIAQSFHPLLGVLEVTLRNQLNSVLTTHFSDPDWIISQKNGFMIDPTLTRIDRRTGRRITNDFLKSSIEKTETRLRRLNVTITSGRIIADQPLGFWTDLFDVHHYRLLLGRPIQCFQHLPPGHGRREVWERLTKIRLFRNRVNHNEPVCFNGTIIDFTYAEDIYRAIVEIMTWMDPALITWTKNIDTVPAKITQARGIQLSTNSNTAASCQT